MRYMIVVGLTAVIATAVAHEEVVAQLQTEVFGPGTVSKSEDNVYRGQFSGDGTEFWFFRKLRADAEDYRIFVSRRQADGSWSEPERATLGGSEFSDLYPAPSPDGRFLVFTSYRPFPGDTSSHPNANLWYAERRGAGWGSPVAMTGASTAANYDSGPWFDRQGVLHFVSTSPDWSTRWHRKLRAAATLASAVWEEDSITEPWRNWRSDQHVWHATPSPDGTFMILDVSEIDARGRRGPSELWIARRTQRGWSEPIKLGEQINTPEYYENFVVFTPDGRDMLFAREFRVYHRVSVSQLLASTSEQ